MGRFNSLKCDKVYAYRKEIVDGLYYSCFLCPQLLISEKVIRIVACERWKTAPSDGVPYGVKAIRIALAINLLLIDSKLY